MTRSGGVQDPYLEPLGGAAGVELEGRSFCNEVEEALWWSRGTAYIVVVEQCVFLPLVGWWLAAERYLLGEDELFSSCCLNALCPALTPGLRMHA